MTPHFYIPCDSIANLSNYIITNDSILFSHVTSISGIFLTFLLLFINKFCLGVDFYFILLKKNWSLSQGKITRKRSSCANKSNQAHLRHLDPFGPSFKRKHFPDIIWRRPVSATRIWLSKTSASSLTESFFWR